ncbi:amino acid permease [Sulfodiicoccus acidiphilus]|nr:amino acid permease [Sulfodiicoccus acidiphilus]
MIPRTGAIVRYPHYTHGSYTGYIMGWLYLLSTVSVPAIEAEAVVGYAATYIPSLTYSTTVLGTSVTVLTGLGILMAIVLMIAFFFLNYFGIRFLGKFNTGVTWWKFILPTLTFLLLFASFHASNFTAYGGFFPSANLHVPGITGVAAMFYAIPTTGIVFSYLGFRQALEYGGEAKTPQRDVPRATIFSVAVAILIYTLLQVSFIGAIDWSKIQLTNSTGAIVGPIQPGNWGQLLTSTWASGPFYNALVSTSIPALVAFSYLLLIDAWISPSGTGWIYMGTGTRTFYGLATDQYIPSAFVKLSKYKIPIWSLVASLVVGAIFLLPFPSWYLLVSFISSATVFTYVMGGISLTVLRKTASTLHRPFRLSGAQVLAPIASMAAVLIVYWSGFSTLFFIISGVFLGLPLFFLLYAPRKLGTKPFTSYLLGALEFAIILALSIFGYYYVIVPGTLATEPISTVTMYFAIYYVLTAATVIGMTFALQAMSKDKTPIRAGYWLIGLILAMYLLSFFGAFGFNTLIPFPYDTVVAAIVGIGFYFAATRSGFKTDEIEEIVNSAPV